jgi:hypothetical protein
MQEQQCTHCGESFPRRRSRSRGYKVTRQHGCLCDGCYQELIRTTVYEYGCGKEFYGGYTGTEAAIGQMKLANRFRNALVEIDRFEQNEFRRLTADPETDAEIEKQNSILDSIRNGLKQKRKEQRTRRIKPDDETKSRLAQAKAALSELYARNRAQRVCLRVQNAAEILCLRSEVESRMKAAASDAASAGLPWTMLEPIKAEHRIAASRAKKAGVMLRFRRFDGSGRIIAPFTRGLALSAAYRSDEAGKFQISGSLMTSHPRERRTLCRIAIATVDRKPVWLSVPVVFDRPLPPEERRQNLLACGMDVGWRKRPDGSIRVAYWVDQNGDHGELLFPAGDMNQFRELDGIWSVMEREFYGAREKLTHDLESLTAIPDVLQERFRYISHWRSPSRLIRAMSLWSRNRFSGDEQAWNRVAYWYYGDQIKPSPSWNGHLHLSQWWHHLNDQILRKRRELYRVFAASLCQKYGRIFVEEFDLSEIVETPDAEFDTEYAKEAKYQRGKAAISTLRTAIEHACAREGVLYRTIAAQWSSHICVCGSRLDFDAAANLIVRCGTCGNLYDQDFLGARNILDGGLSRVE